MSREALKKYLEQREPILEIGPLISPFVLKDTCDVYYADIRDTDGVYNDYENCSDYGTPEEIHEKIATIDYVVQGTYLEAVREKRFGAVFSSHVIEHVPNILGHLIEISEILNDGGLFVLAIPDKRYTFDRFREVTPFRDAYDVYVSGTQNTARLALDCVLNTHLCNNPILHRVSDILFRPVALDDTRIPDAKSLYDSVKNGGACNMHLWVFTYPSFLALLRDGIRFSLLPFTLEYSTGPEYYSNEFHIVLKKDLDLLSDGDKRGLEIDRLSELIEAYESNPDPNPEPKAMKEFFNQYSVIYIYGAGLRAREFFQSLQRQGCAVAGFIVSDGKEKPETLFGLPAYYLSQMKNGNKDCGIIIGMNDDNREQVTEILDKRGFNYI